MSDPFLGEIKIFAGNFAPRSWAFCDGQLLNIAQYNALFSLLGTTYSGDGRTTFGLPDLRGRIPIHAGNGPGLTPRAQGARAGAETVAVSEAQMPSHVHPSASANHADQSNPVGNVPGHVSSASIYADSGDASMAADTSVPAGGGQPHANVMPFLCVYFIIALQGVYPSRS